MARKRSRKSGGGAKDSGATIDKIERYEDTIEKGGVDDFMFKRDQIMFNPRDDEEDDDINGDLGEEVFGLEEPKRRMTAEEDEEMEEDDYDEEDDEDEAPAGRQRKEKAKVDYSTKGRYGKESDSEDAGSESEEEEGWGRQYYSRPSTRREKEGDEYDSEREEERELEEKEVRRLQRKAREAVAAEDWGLDDVLADGDAAPAKVDDEEETKAPVPVPETKEPAALVRHLAAHEPLKLALVRDFPLVLRKLRKTARGIKAMSAEAVGEENLHKGLGWLHYQTLLTYATTLAFYIHLCALPAAERPDLSTHPVLERLLQLKQGVVALEDLDFAAGSVSDAGPELFVRPGEEDWDDEEDPEEMAELLASKRELMDRMNMASGMGLPDDEDDEDDEIDEEEHANQLWHTAGLEDGELSGLLQDQQEQAGKRKRTRGKKGKKSKKAASPSPSDSESDEEEAPTASFTPIAEPSFVSSKKSKKSKSSKVPKAGAIEDIYGDADELDEADAADKERRKRSLRFHTSKIAATAARRTAAKNRRLGGDDDIPYRDRQAARDAALRKNAPKGSGGEDLDGGEWTEADRKRAREVRDEADAQDEDDDGYYDLVKRRKTAKEEEKREAHEAYREAKFASMEDETTDGPRTITRAIEKNRGLTPRRNKAGRNPRVKKKLAFEKAKRKVSSQRAVYKGGQASLGGQYSGEKTGISTVAKSRKF